MARPEPGPAGTDLIEKLRREHDRARALCTQCAKLLAHSAQLNQRAVENCRQAMVRTRRSIRQTQARDNPGEIGAVRDDVYNIVAEIRAVLGDHHRQQ